MPHRYDDYGFRTASLEEARVFVEAALGLGLGEGDSIVYHGLHYVRRPTANSGFTLQRNYDPQTGECFNRWYAGYTVLFNVSDLHPDEMDRIRDKLTHGRDDPVLVKTYALPDEPDQPDEPENEPE